MIEPGCYIDENYPRDPEEITEMLLDILDSLGGNTTKFREELEAMLDPDDDENSIEYIRDLDDDITEAIQEALPEDRIAFWEMGGFYILDYQEALAEGFIEE